MGKFDQVASSEENKVFMDQAVSTVRDWIAENQWKSDETSLSEEETLFEMAFNLENGIYRARINIESIPRELKAEVVISVIVESKYSYIVCEEIVKRNFNRRFGAFQYDVISGDLIYRYSVMVEDQITENMLDWAMAIIISTATQEASDIRRYSVGRLKDKEKAEVLGKITSLVKDLTEE